MNYWLVSDTHFAHAKLNEWGGREGEWQEKLYAGIALIPREDVLIHLGDICIGDDVEVHKRLFGEKDTYCGGFAGGAASRMKSILVRGNHDKKSMQWYIEHGWDFVCDGLELIYMGRYLHLTHRPSRPQGHNMFNIHGHTHGNMHREEEYLEFYDKNYHIDISPELVGYTPIRLDTLLKGKK